MSTDFQPIMTSANQALNWTVSTTTASAVKALGNSSVVVLTNTHATAIAYINWGTAGCAATTSDMPILPGNQIRITRPPGPTHIAHIGSASLTLLGSEGA